MDMWVVYDHPLDFPDHYVARRWHMVIGPGEGFHPTSDVLLGDTLENLWAQKPWHLVALTRDPDDDPKIIQVWI